MGTKNSKTVNSSVSSSVANFDFLQDLDLSKFENKKTTRIGASEIYKIDASFDEQERKTARRKLKKQRDVLVANLLHTASLLKKQNNAENKKNFEDAAKEFKSFYMKNYLVTDFTIQSISAANSTKKGTLQIALDIAKNI